MVDVKNEWDPAVWSAYRAGALTRSGRDVLLTLRTFRGARGLIYPSHARLAKRVGCCERTVRTALADAREAGLVTWVSGRRRRSSNRYSLAVPHEVGAARVPRRAERLAVWAAHALVGNRRREGEHQLTKGLIGDRVLASHPPLRTVTQQIAALMRPGSKGEKLEVRESLAAIATRRAAERNAGRQAQQVATHRGRWVRA